MPGRSERTGRRARGGGRRGRIAVAWGEFNPTVTEEMRDRAVRAIEAAGYEAAPVLAVSGSYDLPFAVDRALRQRGVVAAVAIGCIVTGETKHDEVIAHAAAKSLLDVSLARGKPVGLGITGPGQTYQQAKDRVDRAEAAVDAVLKLLRA
jgi:6,7-dimethyl-8-ribityllumazine synthase